MSSKSSTLNIAALSAEERAVLMAQLQEVSKDRQAQVRHTYAEHMQPLMVSIIENETLSKSDKSDWIGYSVRSVPVTVEGHTFTVSVTVTDTQAKTARQEERELAEARAKVAAAEAKAAAEADA